jgi:nitroreductase
MFSEEFQKIVELRRSNRSFDTNTEVPSEVIEKSIKRSILAPNSSNMQLWEFQWVESEKLLKELSALCLSLPAASTAKHMVVFITRKDLWKQRAKWNYEQIAKTIKGDPSRLQKRGLDYYKKLIPLVYMNDPLFVLTFLRRVISFFGGIRKPFYRLGGRNEQRIVVHKSCALAAQTFMLSIAAEGFHSCPMEGFDKHRVKRMLKLPYGAEINMIVSVGKGTDKGIWGPRYRVPYNEVVKKI